MLYVATVDGTKVGRVNLATGRVTMDRADLRAEFDRFVAGWRFTYIHENAAAAPIDSLPGKPSPAESAGASAQREYDRRSTRELAAKQQRVTDDARWREQIKEERPVLGRVASAFTAKPQIGPESQATAAWKVGAEGERRVAEVLANVSGIEVLHDRLIPGSRANIDHIVIGPAGVFIVDAKKYQGRVQARDVGKASHLDQRLYVNGRDRTKLVDGVQKQMALVRRILHPAGSDVRVAGVLCFIDAEWGLVMRRQRAKGVVALWPKALPRHVARGGPFASHVGEIAQYIERSLRPAG